MRMAVSIVVPGDRPAPAATAASARRRRHARASDLIAQLQEEPGEACFHPRARELCQPARELSQADREPRQQPADERRILFEQAEEGRLLDAQDLRGLERERRGHERRALVDRHRAERIAGSEDLEDDLLASGRGLEHLDAAGCTITMNASDGSPSAKISSPRGYDLEPPDLRHAARSTGDIRRKKGDASKEIIIRSGHGRQ